MTVFANFMQMQKFEKIIVNSILWNWLLREHYLPRLFRLVNVTDAHHALELGCGQGMTTAEILRRFPHLRLTALDYDPDQVVRARERLNGLSARVSVRQGDATDLDLSDDHFDAVFACNLFHHIQDYPRALAEVARVLKPQGKLYVMDLDRRFFNPLFRNLFPPEALFTQEEFVHELEAVALRVQASAGNRWIFFVCAHKLDRCP